MTLRGFRVALLVSALLAALVCSLGTRSAWAQPAPAVAQKAMLEGDRASQAGKWADALASYQKAHAASPSSATAIRLANALYKLNRSVEAHNAYETAVEQFSKTLLGADKKLANDRLTELKAKTGTLTINASETGAAVTVDGVAAGTSPLAKPVRVEAGSRKVAVQKDGFQPFETTIEVAGKAALTVEAKLKPVEKGTSISILAKSGKMEVTVDGTLAGETPIAMKLLPGPHKVVGTAPDGKTAEVSVDVQAGVAAEVVLDPNAGKGTLEVRTEMPKSQIEVDGEKVGEGSFKGEVSPGEHTLRVTLEGFEPAEKKVNVGAGEVVAETITLRKATAGAVVETAELPWSFNGLYGGIQLAGMFEPAGSGNSLDSSCDVLGATSCESSVPMGGGVGGYIGYAFAPIGLELLVLGAGDVAMPGASFDGKKGSEINPLVAAPAREESFVIGRFGGGGAARLRLLFPVDRFRFTGAIGAGLAYRHMLLGRDTVADSGATSSVGNGDGNGYISGVLSVELAAQVLLGGTTSFALGASLWLEHAGDGLTTPAQNDVFLIKEGNLPQPQATPAYVLASSTQVFIGPFLGLHFGP